MKTEKIKEKIKSLKNSRNEAVEYTENHLRSLNLEEAKMCLKVYF